jgi:hypothetical protein
MWSFPTLSYDKDCFSPHYCAVCSFEKMLSVAKKPSLQPIIRSIGIFAITKDSRFVGLLWPDSKFYSLGVFFFSPSSFWLVFSHLPLDRFPVFFTCFDVLKLKN